MLSAYPGVVKAVVSFEHSLAEVWGDVNTQDLVDEIELVGFDAFPASDQEHVTQEDEDIGLDTSKDDDHDIYRDIEGEDLSKDTTPLMISSVRGNRNKRKERKEKEEEEESKNGPRLDQDSFVLSIGGMLCTSCSSKVESCISRTLPHVEKVSVSVTLCQANVVMEAGVTLFMKEVDALCETITELGFPAQILKVTLKEDILELEGEYDGEEEEKRSSRVTRKLQQLIEHPSMQEKKAWAQRFKVVAFFGIPLLIIHISSLWESNFQDWLEQPVSPSTSSGSNSG